MHIDRGFLNWGVFLIAVGAVPLAVRAGIAAPTIRWWELWPLVLVGWGLGLILGRTPFALLGGILVAATVGLAIGGILASGTVVGGFANVCGSGSGTTFATQQGSFASQQATVRLEPGCGRLEVSSGGAGWEVAGESPDGEPPRIDASGDRLVVETPDRGFDPFDAGGGRHWTVRLPADRAIDLDVSANAGQAQLALAGATLGEVSLSVNAASATADLSAASVAHLDVSANAGTARLTLPAANVSGSLSANAGSIDVCVPAGTALRIATSGSLGGNNFDDRGLTQSGDTWTTPDYASASTRIDLSASANLGSITLNPDGGCG
jgi:hypothetical protein